jgi:hypothetical protein
MPVPLWNYLPRCKRAKLRTKLTLSGPSDPKSADMKAGRKACAAERPHQRLQPRMPLNVSARFVGASLDLVEVVLGSYRHLSAGGCCASRPWAQDGCRGVGFWPIVFTNVLTLVLLPTPGVQMPTQVARGALRKTFESAEMLVDSLSIWGGKQPL